MATRKDASFDSSPRGKYSSFNSSKKKIQIWFLDPKRDEFLAKEFYSSSRPQTSNGVNKQTNILYQRTIHSFIVKDEKNSPFIIKSKFNVLSSRHIQKRIPLSVDSINHSPWFSESS
eukprot:TRINITY_DN21098_c0_g1_i2.p1 TRINITY_DN21098_c0_g1~~TRINITY_DN21098_c0_g1_i2.p1  ORF type:complete len:117 (-),score=8.21 TRINITY_DN21098_c0_g1_i2:382-732(-)